MVALVVAQPGLFSRWSSVAGQLGGGVLMGTLFGTITLFAIWVALGTTTLGGTITRSVVCCLAIGAAATINALIGGVPINRLPPLSMLFCVVAIVQCLLVTGLLWILGKASRARLCHLESLPSGVRTADQQFGIREVLVVTAIIAVLLGAIRLILQLAPGAASPLAQGAIIWGYWVLCNVFIVVPVIVAPLLRRFALACTLIALVFVGVVTGLEVTALHRIEKGPDTGWIAFALGNYVQSAWVLLALVVLRYGGYRLVKADSTSRAGDRSASQPHDPI
jgi:hypothetical protein